MLKVDYLMRCAVYEIVEDSNLMIFEKKVSQRLLDGWLPIGGVAVYTDSNNYPVYCQAMLKPEDNEDENAD